MRLVQVTIPAGKRETVADALDEEEIDYAITDEIGGREYTAIVWFPLPTDAVEPVLETLREAGLDEHADIVVVDAQTVLSEEFEELQERYEEEEQGERIAREEMIVQAQGLAPTWPLFLVLTTISAIVATAGVLLDSPAVVVGSMVIAPLIGPAMATSVGTVIGDRDLFKRGAKLQFAGILIGIGSAAAFALLVKSLYLVPPGLEVLSISQIKGRLSPDFLSLAVALGAGIAGALSLTSGVSTALVGVMIAAALVPPMAVVGVGIAWQEPRAILGPMVLVFVNFLSINLAALIVMWHKGYRPGHWFKLRKARSTTLKRVAVLAVAIVVFSGFLGGATYASYQQSTFEQTAKEGVLELTADGGAYEQLELLNVEVTYGEISVRPYGEVSARRYLMLSFRDPKYVIVTVGRSGSQEFPGLASAIQKRIANETERRVGVRVRIIQTDSVGIDTDKPIRPQSKSPPVAPPRRDRTARALTRLIGDPSTLAAH